MTYPYKFSKCVLAAYRESSFLSRLQIELSEEEFPIWCYNVFWREFMAPQHLDRKICGIILCLKTRSAYDYVGVGANLQNKTKGTSYHLTRHGSYFSRMCIMFFPLDNTTLVVDAGDWLALDFQENDNNDQCFSGFGVCLIYKGDVMEPTANNVHQTTGFSGIRSVPGDDVYKLLIEDRPYDYQEDDDDDSDSDENLHESQRTDDADYHPFFEPYHVGLTHNNL